MSKIQWQDNFNIGIDEIDLQHKKLLQIFNELYALSTDGSQNYRVLIGKTLKKLSNYTHYHFSEEENVMQHYDYPELDTHKSLHQDFINKLSTSTKLILAGDSTQGLQLCSFLLDWILNHILKSDKKMALYINTK